MEHSITSKIVPPDEVINALHDYFKNYHLLHTWKINDQLYHCILYNKEIIYCFRVGLNYTKWEAILDEFLILSSIK